MIYKVVSEWSMESDGVGGEDKRKIVDNVDKYVDRIVNIIIKKQYSLFVHRYHYVQREKKKLEFTRFSTHCTSQLVHPYAHTFGSRTSINMHENYYLRAYFMWLLVSSIKVRPHHHANCLTMGGMLPNFQTIFFQNASPTITPCRLYSFSIPNVLFATIHALLSTRLILITFHQSRSVSALYDVFIFSPSSFPLSIRGGVCSQIHIFQLFISPLYLYSIHAPIKTCLSTLFYFLSSFTYILFPTHPTPTYPL